MPLLITVKRTDDLHHVTLIQEVDGLVLFPADHHPLTGQVAELLYMALTGHAFTTGPDQAQPGLAYHARAIIARYAHLSDTWALANVTVLHFGNWYQPWLGLLKVDADGNPISNDPDYQRRHIL